MDKCGRCSNPWRNTIAPATRQLRDWLGRYPVGLLSLFCALLAISGCSSERHLSFLNPQGPIAATQRSHFIDMLVLLGVFVALPIFVLTPWLAWRYRYRAKSRRRYTPKWAAFLPLEIMTWAGPIVIVGMLALLVWRATHALDPYKPIAPNAPALQVQAIGYDWKWLFIYPDQGIASVGVMTIPVGVPVAMHLTSATVMQSLHIPALVSQIYAMGGMVTQLHLMATKPGRSLGENNMYNGKGFHQQDFTAIAIPPDKFKAWVRKVRMIGMPLDAHTYKALSQRGTVAELATTLPRASRDGNVYFTGVPAALFRAVVKATNTVPRSANSESMEKAP